MRLGAYPCAIRKDSLLHRIYQKELIEERHRHRYEFHNDYREEMNIRGLSVTGASPDGRLVEAVEIEKNDFYIGVQFHPEFKSRPNRAQPIFREFIGAALRRKEKRS